MRPKGRLHGNAQSQAQVHEFIPASSIDKSVSQMSHYLQDQYSIVNSNLITATSSKVILHLIQVTRFSRFQFYDYGQAINLKIYNVSSPPEYTFANAKVPISIFYADADPAVTRKVRRDVTL